MLIRGAKRTNWLIITNVQSETLRRVCTKGLLFAVHLGFQVIFYQLSPLTLQVTVDSRNARQIILSPSVPETGSIQEMNFWNIPEGGA